MLITFIVNKLFIVHDIHSSKFQKSRNSSKYGICKIQSFSKDSVINKVTPEKLLSWSTVPYKYCTVVHLAASQAVIFTDKASIPHIDDLFDIKYVSLLVKAFYMIR